MTVSKIALCFIFPPLAVLDKGCLAITITTICSLFGFWFGGFIPAILFCLAEKK